MSWIDDARRNIAVVDRELSADASLPERRKALRRAGPAFHGGTYWGRKQWGKACREYLERHGQPPRFAAAKPEDSPKFGPDIIFPFRGKAPAP